MGGLFNPPNFIDIIPFPENHLRKYDAHVSHWSVNAGEVVDIADFMKDMWKIRSSYQDTLIPIKENIRHVSDLQERISHATNSIRQGNLVHPNITMMVEETAKIYGLYANYAARLRKILHQLSTISLTFSHHRTAIFEELSIDVGDELGKLSQGLQKILYAVQLCRVLAQAAFESLVTANQVIACAKDNLIAVAKYFGRPQEKPHEGFEKFGEIPARLLRGFLHDAIEGEFHILFKPPTNNS